MTTRRVLLAAPLLAVPRLAAAQSWPAGRAITIIVPYAPGGGVDTAARMIAAGLERELSTGVQVLNRPGAGSQIGITEFLRSRPDGLTLAFAVLPTLITHYLDPSRRAPYTRADFRTVALHHISPVSFAVRSASPWPSIGNLVEAARARPEAISVSDSGLMATPHLGVLMLQMAAGVRFNSIHFNGGAPSVTALLGGHVDVLAGGGSDVLGPLSEGSFRVLGTTGEQRDPLLPGVPTLREQGLDVVVASAGGLLAPAGTPDEAVARLAEAVRAVMAAPAYDQAMRRFGLVPDWKGPADYAAYWERDEARMRPIMAALARG
ncbi:tripartite tricarboxylate transporter substrate binding protein [Roseomonas sp. AR75]|uniref:tripartite tricarboxylate transporter substrate binding protein n=1 Tax=Roseomonas sp. AR75 TaxID=2562311 RepID=UPI0014859F60|nr:tripartite tricarboxylate transporter substrate binding protein [Roseomonas sp. AR75]